MKRRQFIVLGGVVLGAALPLPTLAATYLTVEQAGALMFPDEALTPQGITLDAAQARAIEQASGVRVRNKALKAWRAARGGWLLVDEVVGKHEFITWALALDAGGAVKQVEILDYRETYGGEVRNERWRAQFVGKRAGAPLRLDEDIQNISGATLSCAHVTEGVRRLLATYDLVLRPLA